jgi:arsenate reductase
VSVAPSCTALSVAELPEFGRVLDAAALPSDDLALTGRCFFRFTTSGETIGFAGFERHGDNALLRTIVVLPAQRGRGFGRAMVKRLLELAARADVRHAYLLTTTARAFFERAEFAVVDLGAAPAAIRATEQATRLCPASAALIHRRITTMTITIYHNPACGTSRNVLGLIRNSGAEPIIIEYLKHPPARATLLDLIGRMNMKVRELLRRKGTPYDELKLDNPALTDDQLIDAMLAHPILINRPIVETPLGVKLCRPSETVLDILPQPQRGAFSKEDGEPVINEAGRPVVAPEPRQ